MKLVVKTFTISIYLLLEVTFKIYDIIISHKNINILYIHYKIYDIMLKSKLKILGETNYMNLISLLQTSMICSFASCFILTIIFIISLGTGNKKIMSFAFIAIGAITFILMGIIVPFTLVTSIIGNLSGILLVALVILIVWFIISLLITFKNKLIILRHKEKNIYIRDIDVPYSPAILSYLINNKIETKKDLSATLLNLCANNILKIEKENNGTLKFIDLKNQKEIEKLSQDEYYAYEMFTQGITTSKIKTWKAKIKEEYEKYKFSKEHKRDLSSYLMFFYMAFIIIMGIIASLFDINNLGQIISNLIVIIFFAGWEMTIFKCIKLFVKGKVAKDSEFIDIYTKKGAIEFDRWKKFESFIEGYTLIKDREAESIVILGKYLSYSIALGINKKCDNELQELINAKYDFNYTTLFELF